jgi:hypothetical protein
VAVAVVTMGILNGARAWQSCLNLVWLAEWDLPIAPRVLLVLSTLWAGVFLCTGWGLFRRRGWARRLVIRLVPLYGLFNVLATLAFVRSPYHRDGWVLTAAGWAIVSLLVCWMLTRGRFRVQFNVR